MGCIVCACVRIKCVADAAKPNKKTISKLASAHISNKIYGKSKNCTQNVSKDNPKTNISFTNDRISDSLIDLLDFIFD